ncbi:MAG: NADH-ubiquinone oxidoreductase-F iron-sulfur binding region domain-containing protein [Planctomycetota bacterium]
MTNRRMRFQPIAAEVQAAVDAHGRSPEDLLEVLRELHDLHDEGLTVERLTDAARALGIPVHRAYGVATFHSMLSLHPREHVLRVCESPVCWLEHAGDGHLVLDADALPEGWTVERTSCLGLCDRAPVALVDEAQAGPIVLDDLAELVDPKAHGPMPDYWQPRPGETRVMLADIDRINPDELTSARVHGVYEGLERALSMSPQEVIAEVGASGLQGRGGAGFPTARKWGFVAGAEGEIRHIVCNADESEPLVFKDRVLLDTNPHQILEGMAIAAHACGASEGWIYIRGEYVPQARRLERAIAQAEAHGLLGEDVLGRGLSFRVHLHLGAGAYICGEETALIESLEGKRGEPRIRPPYPPQHGFRGQPTAVNNVETLAGAAWILRHGADAWRSLSECETPGTKLYMVLGHVRNPGLFEAPFGLTLRQVIEDFGGGMRDGSAFHFALCGGAAGTIVDEGLLDVPLDYTSWKKGISLGAGAFLVVDRGVSPVDFLREELHFFATESCGKCTPCRVGTWRAHGLLKRLAAGEGRPGDLDELRALTLNMRETSFCGLGQSVAIPVFSALEHFPEAFERAGSGRRGEAR